MRLFLAINLPKKIKQDLFLLSKQLSAELQGSLSLKPVEENNLHITLRFLGDISEQKKDFLVKTLRTIAFPSFDLNFDTLDFFTYQRKPRVVFVHSRSEQFTNLVLQIDQRLKTLGLSLDSKPQECHITLFRVKFVKDLNSSLRILKNFHDLKEPFSIKVKSFELMESKLTPKGPIYKVLESFSLE